MYKNKFDRDGQCSVMGVTAEVSFQEILKDLGEVSAASFNGQMSHIDFNLVTADKKKVKYEVKARKRVSRQDTEVNDDLIWIEFMNVQGKLGWLYGKADFIAFERNNDFVVVNRLNLVAMAEEKCKVLDKVTYSGDALYKGYQRKGRNDLISIVRMSDILPLGEIWMKKALDNPANPV
jgi:hypothetical protein